MENDALKKKVLDTIRQHDLPIGEDDPITELAVLHQVLFEQHLERVGQLLDEQKHRQKHEGAAFVERFNRLFNVFAEKLKDIRLNTRLPKNERWLFNGLLILTVLNSLGLLFIIGKVLGYF